MITLSPPWEQIHQLVEIYVSQVIRHPDTTSDECLILAEAYDEVGAVTEPPQLRAIYAAAASYLRRMAPIFAGRALRSGCPAGLGAE